MEVSFHPALLRCQSARLTTGYTRRLLQSVSEPAAIVLVDQTDHSDDDDDPAEREHPPSHRYREKAQRRSPVASGIGHQLHGE